jgi:hypothetical protein
VAKVGTSKAGGTISQQAAVHPWLAADAHVNKQTSNSYGCLIKCYLQRMYKYLGIAAMLEVLIIGFWIVECSYMF